MTAPHDDPPGVDLDELFDEEWLVTGDEPCPICHRHPGDHHAPTLRDLEARAGR